MDYTKKGDSLISSMLLVSGLYISLREGQMKCWECKEQVVRATRIPYTDGEQDKHRDVCGDCLKLLTFNKCHFVEVERITRRQIKQKRR